MTVTPTARRRRDSSVLARREFLKTTGAVVVGFSVAQTVAARPKRRAAACGTRREVGPARPGGDRFVPRDPSRQHGDDFRRLRRSRTGRTDRALSESRPRSSISTSVKSTIVRADTFVSTNGSTAASRTAGIGGTEMRVAAAEARRVLLESGLGAAEGTGPGSDGGQGRRLGATATRNGPSPTASCWGTNRSTASSRPSPTAAAPSCRARAGTLRRSSRARSTRSWARGFPGSTCREGQRQVSVHAARARPGHAARPRRVAARPGRRRRQPAESGEHRRAVDQGHSGVRIIRRRNFIGVVAEREWDAVRASRQLKVTWEPFPAVLPGSRGRSRQLPRGEDQ